MSVHDAAQARPGEGTANSERVERALRAGLRFLLDHQSADGAWRDFNCRPGRSEAWTTAYVGSRIAASVRTGGTHSRSAELFHALENAASYLMECVSHDGGWGYNRKCHIDCDTTSQVVLFLKEMGRPVALRHYARIGKFQLPDGAFATYRGAREYGDWALGHPDVTVVALRALCDVLDGNHGIVQRGLASLQRHIATAGGDQAYWWRSRHYLAREMLRLAERLGEAAPLVDAHAVSASALGCFDEALALEVGMLRAQRAGSGLKESGYVESLTGAQLADGSWPTQPILRIPPRHGLQDAPIGLTDTTIVADDLRLFTTATVIGALAIWDKRGNLN
ncbi:MAG TPA: hypothetical protein VGU46_03965 [Acidobacteriaceae bacterium]|nr:hypothetical protein [Acidobacteriaceae bacterium]